MADIALLAENQVRPVHPTGCDLFDAIFTETMTGGQAGYQLTTGKWGIADANVAGKQQAKGVLLYPGGGAGQAGTFLIRGLVYGFNLASQTYDDIIYVSDTAGSFADAAGTLAVPVGRVVALPDSNLTKVIFFDFRLREAYA
jgi:hypothetical protein